jgi:plastocyanin
MRPQRVNHGMVSLFAILSAGLLFATGGIHLDLYLTGYRFIPTIGWLFLLQIISTFALALSILAIRDSVVALSASLFSLSTLGGYILSRAFGLFGFREIRTTAGIVAGLIEVALFCSSTALAYRYAHDSVEPDGGARHARVAMPAALLAPMRIAIAPIALITLGLLLSAEYATSNGSHASPTHNTTAAATTPSGTATVVIKNFAFIPASITVHAGQTVLVRNEDGVSHTLTALTTTTPHGTFDTGNINPGASATITAPGVVGKYRYDCTVHPFMIGAITVN